MEGTTLTYGPLTGALELAPAAPGAAPVVTLDGQPVAPRAGARAGRAGTRRPWPAPRPVPARRRAAARGEAAAGRQAAAAGRRLTVKVAVPARRRAEGDRPAQGARARPREGEAARAPVTRKLTVRLKRRPPRKVALTVTFKPAGGKLQTSRSAPLIRRRARASSSTARRAARGAAAACASSVSSSSSARETAELTPWSGRETSSIASPAPISPGVEDPQVGAGALGLGEALEHLGSPKRRPSLKQGSRGWQTSSSSSPIRQRSPTSRR